MLDFGGVGLDSQKSSANGSEPHHRVSLQQSGHLCQVGRGDGNLGK